MSDVALAEITAVRLLQAAGDSVSMELLASLLALLEADDGTRDLAMYSLCARLARAEADQRRLDALLAAGAIVRFPAVPSWRRGPRPMQTLTTREAVDEMLAALAAPAAPEVPRG